MNNAKEYYNIHSIDYVDKWDLSPKGLEKPANYYRLALIGLMLELAHIQPGEKIIEIGCGTGLVLQELLKITKPIYGIDISVAMLERVKDSLLKENKVLILNNFSTIADSKMEVDIFLTQGDLLELNLPKNDFDKILSMEVFRYIDDLSKCLKNIRAIMKNESTFVFTVTNLYSFNLFPIKYSLRKIFGKIDQNKELLQYFITESSIRRELKKAGFVITAFKKTNFFHWNDKLSKVPIINRFFDTFIIAVKLDR